MLKARPLIVEMISATEARLACKPDASSPLPTLKGGARGCYSAGVACWVGGDGSTGEGEGGVWNPSLANESAAFSTDESEIAGGAADLRSARFATLAAVAARVSRPVFL